MTPPNLMKLLFLLPFIWVYPALNPPSVAAGLLQNGKETVVPSQLAPRSPHRSAHDSGTINDIKRKPDPGKPKGGSSKTPSLSTPPRQGNNSSPPNCPPPSSPPPHRNALGPSNRPPPSFPPPPGITAANGNKSMGKKVGVLFLGIVAFLQVCAVLFLFFKKRQLEATAKHS